MLHIPNTTMEKIKSRIKMLAALRDSNIRIGSKQEENGRRVTIIRNGRRVFGSQVYENYTKLNKAFLRALEYEYNKLIS